MECRLEDRECWSRAECTTSDYICQTLKNTPQLFEYVLGQECRDEECSVRGRYLSEVIFPVLKACSEEAAGDPERYANCLLDMADLLDEIPGFVDSVPGVQSLAHAESPRPKEMKAGTSRIFEDESAVKAYGPFPKPPCEPKDYACVAYYYGELHKYAVGSEGCYDEACSKKGYRPAWILWPVLKACGEGAEDRKSFYSCLKGISSLFRNIAQQFR